MYSLSDPGLMEYLDTHDRYTLQGDCSYTLNPGLCGAISLAWVRLPQSLS